MTDSRQDVGSASSSADMFSGFSTEQKTLTLPGWPAHGGRNLAQLICRLWSKDSFLVDQILQVASLYTSMASRSQRHHSLSANLAVSPVSHKEHAVLLANLDDDDDDNVTKMTKLYNYNIIIMIMITITTN